MLGAPKPATFPCSEILHQVLTVLQKKTAAYLYAESILEAKVPAATWAAEQPALRQQFMDGLLDEELLKAIDDQPEDWLLEGLLSFRLVLTRCQSRAAYEQLKLTTGLATKAATANMDMLCADLAEDAMDVRAYKEALERSTADKDRRVCHYKRRRYANGV